jgi:long-chain acyl-CoA synthetase
VSASSDQALSEDPKVQALMQAEVDKFAAEFKGFEEVKKVGVLPEDFTTENGMMTPSMKVKRRVVLEKYQDKIEALYK